MTTLTLHTTYMHARRTLPFTLLLELADTAQPLCVVVVVKVVVVVVKVAAVVAVLAGMVVVVVVDIAGVV